MKKGLNLLLLLAAVLFVAPACGSSDSDTGGKDTVGDVIEGDLGVDAGDTLETDTPENGDVGDDTACVPVCEDKVGNPYECGGDSCNGSCGTCTGGKICENHLCVVNTAKIAFGGECKMLEECQPYNEDNTENQDFPFCNWEQCEDAVCNIPYCTKDCTVRKDEVNNSTGAQSPDGIEDEDAPQDDCAGALDGPVGTSFRCVNLLLPDDANLVSRCQPGTTFKACELSTDCPEGETCQLLYIMAEYTKRCAIPVKDEFNGGKGVGENCNNNPFEGEEAYCAEDLCFGIGCVNYCKVDNDCLTGGATCTSSKCSNNDAQGCTEDSDCSAFACAKDFDLIGDGTMPTDICFPKNCTSDDSCVDGDFHCTFFMNGAETLEAFDWEYFCVANPADGVANGEQCDPYWQDGTQEPACNSNFCVNGYCSGICKTNADCVEDQLCVTEEYPVDFDEDDYYDKVLPYGICSSLPGSGDLCQTNADCTNDEYCVVGEFPVEGKAWTYEIVGHCAEFENATGVFGDFCGWGTVSTEDPMGVSCKSGFCAYFDQENGFGLCTEYCNSNADCPESVTVEGTEYATRCDLNYFGYNGTLDDFTDDLYVGYCWVNNPDESMMDCSEDLMCPLEGESCIFMGFTRNPDTDPIMEYLCVSNEGEDDEGNPIVPTKVVGETCDLEGSNECIDIYCVEGKSGGYCSKLCSVNEDCAEGLVCAPRIYVDREGEDKDVAYKMCQQDSSCVPCFLDSDCVGDRVCVNVGGPGITADYRCAKACADNTECTDATASTLCVESKGKDGKGEGKLACIGKTNGWKCQ